MTVTTDVKELRSALKSQVDIINEGMAKGVKVDGANVEVSTETAAAIQDAMSKATEIKSYIDAARLGDESKSYLEDAPANDPVSMGGYSEPSLPATLGEAFVESKDFKEFVESGAGTMAKPFEVAVSDVTSYGTFDRKDIYTGTLTGGINPRGFGKIQRDAMVPRLHRTDRIRDLFPVATTTSNLIDYMKVTGLTNNAAPVAERTGTVFTLKPKSTLTFTSAQAPVRIIAHWEAMSRTVLADEPQLRATVDNELLYGLRLVEDDQILNGDGTGENLLGVLNTPGIQTYTGLAADRPSDTLRRAATLVRLANAEPNGYVMHPNDWEEIELQKATGDGHYMLVSNISVGAQARVWRQPIVETQAIDEGTFVTAAWGIAAQLYDRERVNVRIAEQHEDFFARNAVAILVEERLALATKRPQCLVKGSFYVAP